MPDTAKFCGNCGSPLVVPEPDNTAPESAIWFHASAPLKFILNNAEGTYWNIPEGDSYIDTDDNNNLEIDLCENAFKFEDGQNLNAIEFDNTIIMYDRLDGAFAGCRAVTELDLISFDVSETLSVDSMFEGCSSLFRLDLSGWDFENLKSCKRMFWGCDSLRHVTVNGCDARTVDIVAKALAMADLHNQVMLHRE